MDLTRYALVGTALGLVLGAWNLVTFWMDPLDDSVTGMLELYVPMFIGWIVAGFVAARRTGRILDAARAGAIFAFAAFLTLWVANIIRVNLFLDVLREWPGWQTTVVARYRASGMESFRAFVVYDYLADAPLKIGTATAIGTGLALLGGVIGKLARS
jgi:hypothetical protein